VQREEGTGVFKYYGVWVTSALATCSILKQIVSYAAYFFYFPASLKKNLDYLCGKKKECVGNKLLFAVN